MWKCYKLLPSQTVLFNWKQEQGPGQTIVAEGHRNFVIVLGFKQLHWKGRGDRKSVV